MASEIFVVIARGVNNKRLYIGLGNALLPGGTKPLHELMFENYLPYKISFKSPRG